MSTSQSLETLLQKMAPDLPLIDELQGKLDGGLVEFGGNNELELSNSLVLEQPLG